MRTRRSCCTLPATLVLASLVTSTTAGCTTDANGDHDCDGLSWTTRIWIIVAAGVVFVILSILAIWLLKRRMLNKRHMPRGPKNAVRYESGQFWEQRAAHLPGFQPPSDMLPVHSRSEPRWRIEDPNLSRALSTEHGRQLVHHARPAVGVSRITSNTSRVSEALPSYEKSLSMPTALAAVGATPPGSPGLRPSFDSQATVTESFQAPHTARQHPKIDEE